MPSVKILSQLLDDTGVDSGDGITKSGVVALKGSTTGANSVVVYDKGLKLGQAAIASDGTWTFNFKLGEGYHTLYALAFDAKGKSAFSNIGQDIVVETRTPTISVLSNSLTKDTGAHDNVSTDGRYQIRGTVSQFYSGPAGLPGTMVQIFDGNTRLGNATVYTDNTWFYAGTLGTGTHNLHAVALDYAGNSKTTAPGATFKITQATSNPTIQEAAESSLSGTFSQQDDDGSVVSRSYSNGTLTQEVTTFASTADTLSRTKRFTAGELTYDAVVHADKSRDVDVLGVKGRPYVAEHDSFDRTGLLTEMLRTRSDNTLVSHFVRADDGSKTTDSFDVSSNLISSSVTRADGSSLTRAFAGGDLIREAVTYAAGSAEMSVTKSYAAAILVSETDVHADRSSDRYRFSSAGDIIGHDVVNSAGKVALSDNVKADGSHAVNLYQGGGTVASTLGRADAFTNAGAGGTTFALGAQAGHDTIAGFHAGPSAVADVLKIDASFASDFSQVQSLMSSSSAGTMIAFNENDSVLLKNVGLPALSAANFSFG